MTRSECLAVTFEEAAKQGLTPSMTLVNAQMAFTFTDAADRFWQMRHATWLVSAFDLATATREKIAAALAFARSQI